MPLVVKYAENKTVPEGEYVAKLSNLEMTNHPQYGDSIRWSFELISPAEHAGVNVTAMSSTKVSPKSKIFSWASAFGMKLVPGEDLDLETLLGKKIKVRVKNKVVTKNVEGKDVTLTFSNVDALSPYVPSGDQPATEVASDPVTTPAEASAPETTSLADADGDDQDFNF